MTAAVYAVLTIAFGFMSYGNMQFRLASLLKPLSLLSPVMGLGLAVGVGIGNLTSPFGFWDIAVMPVVSFGASMLAWWLRRWPWLAMLVQAVVIAVGVAVFPLYLGGGFPIWPNVVWVFLAEAILYGVGYAAWRQTPLFEE